MSETDEDVNEKPEGAVKYGKCPGPFCGGEIAWLFPSDCSEDPWCEGCIDEAHERSHDAFDYEEDWSDEEPDWQDEEFYESEEGDF